MQKLKPILFILSVLFFTHLEAKKSRILVGSPIRQKPKILTEFLASLDRLEQNNYQLDFYFIDDNTLEESHVLLKKFALKHKNCHLEKPQINNEEGTYICNEITHFWKDALIWKVARFKDQIIDFALNHQYDYLFLLDSDLVLHPHTIDQLIEAKKDIISNIFWTSWTPDAMALPQVWQMDRYTLFKREPGEALSKEESNARSLAFINMLKKKGVYEVGGLGACTLISKEALKKGVCFKKIPNYSCWGEDRHFCVRAAALRLSLWVDTHYPALHLYRESELTKVANFIKSCK